MPSLGSKFTGEGWVGYDFAQPMGREEDVPCGRRLGPSAVIWTQALTIAHASDLEEILNAALLIWPCGNWRTLYAGGSFTFSTNFYDPVKMMEVFLASEAGKTFPHISTAHFPIEGRKN